jgi:hypothetical protein
MDNQYLDHHMFYVAHMLLRLLCTPCACDGAVQALVCTDVPGRKGNKVN